MQYAFTCPAPCNHEMKVDAQNDDEAINKLMTAGKAHAKEAHPNMPPMTDAQIKNMLKAGMKKG
jgi:predicted small metal-binding protein